MAKKLVDGLSDVAVPSVYARHSQMLEAVFVLSPKEKRGRAALVASPAWHAATICPALG
jgi:hypothetical protein